MSRARPTDVLVITSTYPRHPDDVAGRFLRDLLEALPHRCTVVCPDAEVKFYSDEFFKLLDENPELGRIIALNSDVTVMAAGRTVSCKK